MENFDQKLVNYMQGKCSPEEANEVQKWLSTPEGEKYLLSQMDQDMALLERKPEILRSHPVQSLLLYHKITEAIASQQSITPEKPAIPLSPQRKRAYVSRWYQMAAVLTGLLLLAFASWLFWGKESRITHQTAYGETKQVTLPDGSTVFLNGNTSLSYAENWDEQQARRVWLDGEAFFSVAHTATHQQFFVHTSEDFNVEVLGTTFNVLKRKDKTKVTLNSGKIRLNLKEEISAEPILMKPGELVEVNDASSKIIKKAVNPEIYSSWKSSKMAFEDTSLADIIVLLEQTYGLTVEISDPTLLGLKFNGTVPSDNVDILLEGLSQLFDLNIKRQNNHVTFNTNK
jgi:transmembrane sensor